LGIYVHVPFCSVRCGYCDFNTYTATELGGGGSLVRYADQAIAEIGIAARQLQGRQVETVFFGGGTPTLLPADDLARILASIDEQIGLAADAEVTTEANPDSLSAAYLNQLRDAGFNRISIGMQSAVPHVLRILERTHDPEKVPLAVQWARAAGFEQLSLDLIYGTAGESVDDWRFTLEAALACEPDHVSAYSLIVEQGTRLARQVKQGLVAAPDDDDLADKYLIGDQAFEQAGLSWYEISNWARDRDSQCQHNLLYWHSDDWWGVGPGAHSHLAGVRWWNVKHPSTFAQSLEAGEQPIAGQETLDRDMQAMEAVMLGIRLREGLDASRLDRDKLAQVIDDGLVQRLPGGQGWVALTERGRLLGDAVARSLL